MNSIFSLWIPVSCIFMHEQLGTGDFVTSVQNIDIQVKINMQIIQRVVNWGERNLSCENGTNMSNCGEQSLSHQQPTRHENTALVLGSYHPLITKQNMRAPAGNVLVNIQTKHIKTLVLIKQEGHIDLIKYII